MESWVSHANCRNVAVPAATAKTAATTAAPVTTGAQMGDVATAVFAVVAPAIAAEVDAAPTAAVAVVIDIAMVSGVAPEPIKPPDIPRVLVQS